MRQISINDPATGADVSGVDYYFVQADGSKFKVIIGRYGWPC